ncbi:Six-hairpin glycosidase-like protein [Vararia minispora EC-137]|uniref:Six-hairpin glycosidase-like protein n=1 Tax=Vararia minispora EC-137 TaxID=1314806 RepID=A0ACB8Q9H9_9AGAM|nr:Six-hairpin glycosidase-like protein [Vararia minispora EC-137]
MALPFLLVSFVSVALAFPAPRDLFHFDVNAVTANAIAIASHSWEYGALTEALIEVQQPQLSVFSTESAFPPQSDKYNIPNTVVSVIRSILNNETAGSPTFINGDGAAGDPASIGPAVLLVNTVEKNQTWAADAERQLNHLLYDVPRSPAGGISQRESEVQFWADFMYMVPPFLAYYGAIEGSDNGTALLQEAYKQCSVYRSVLYDANPSLWEHIKLGSFSLTQHWGTGNGWAALGMMRVYATIKQSKAADQLSSEQDDLLVWVDEIVTGAYKFQGTNGTLYNYLDQYTPGSNATFADTAGTASITAAAYRYMTATGDAKHLVAAERAYQLVAASVDADGWVLNAVDPLTFSTPLQPGNHSPEAQSFALMMKAARDAYQASL